MALTPSRKKQWIDVKHLIKKLNPEVFEILEAIGIDDEPIYEASYEYGFTISDENYFYFIDESGCIKKYTFDNYPYMFLLEKNLELVLESEARRIPNHVYHPGDFMPMTLDLEYNTFKSKPASPFRLIAGSESVTFMPMIKHGHSFSRLQNAYGIENIDIENTTNHFKVIYKIAQQPECKWRAKLLVFSSDIKSKILSYPSWVKLKLFLYEQTIRLSSFQQNTLYLDYALTEIIARRKLNLRPFTIELIKQIILISIGCSVGFKPLTDESDFPTKFIGNAILPFYNINTPVFIGPTYGYRKGEKSYLPISYFQHSLNDPKRFRPSYYLNEIVKNIDTILEDLSHHKLLNECIYQDLHKKLKLLFYSSRTEENSDIRSIKSIGLDDNNFAKIKNTYPKCKLGIASKSSFSNALISIELN